jgi:hypothetical protein
MNRLLWAHHHSLSLMVKEDLEMELFRDISFMGKDAPAYMGAVLSHCPCSGLSFTTPFTPLILEVQPTRTIK